MRHDVRIVVLTLKRLQLNVVDNVNVLLSRIFRDGVFGGRSNQNLIYIIDAQRFVHAPVRFVHIVHLRSLCRHLKLRLCQSNPLGLRKDVGVRDRDHIHAVIKILAHDCAITARYRVRVLLRQIL